MNLQPSEAEAGFDVRVPPTANAEALERRIAEEWAPVSRNMTFEVVINSVGLDIFSNAGKNGFLDDYRMTSFPCVFV